MNGVAVCPKRDHKRSGLELAAVALSYLKISLAAELLLLAGFCLQACGTLGGVKSLFGGVFPVEVQISPDLNQSSPIALEIVVIYDKKVLETLRQMPAREWFEQRAQILRDHQGGLRTWGFEWVPGQEVEPLALRYDVGAKQGVIFADFFSPGPHRLLVDPHRGIRLLLEADGFTVETL